MEITIPPHDVEQAIQEYVMARGLVLQGKTVSMRFVTTRKGGRKVSAILVLDDAAPGIPGFSTPGLSLVSSSAAELALSTVPAGTAPEVVPAPVMTMVDTSPVAVTVAPTTSGTSLFS